MHTTNYQNTFIEIADDSPVQEAEIPPVKGTEKTAANIQFEMLYENPYHYTSDEVMFQVFAHKQGVTRAEWEEKWAAFFSKGQPCMRSSPLTKRYGWGVHSDAEGKIAIYPAESADYKRLAQDPKLAHTKAMRSRRA